MKRASVTQYDRGSGRKRDPVINSSEGTLAHAVGAGVAVPARDVSGTSRECPERSVLDVPGMNTFDPAEPLAKLLPT